MAVGGAPQILLLGTPVIAGCRVDAVIPAKGLQLIALLARAKSGSMKRVLIASILWDSRDDAAALANLRQLLVRMKRTLPELDLFRTDEVSLWLGSSREFIDVCRVEDAAGVADTAAAIELLRSVRGDLLENIAGATEAFDDWLAGERLACRERLLAFASAVLLELTRYGRAARSELDTVSRIMLELDSEREASYRALIEAYGRNGMFDDARRVYQALVSMLHREYGAGPSQETNVVARRVFSWRGPTIDFSAPSAAPPVQPRVAFFKPAWPQVSGREGLVGLFLEDVANELSRHRSFVVLAPHSSFGVDHRSGVPMENELLRADYSVSGFCKPDSGGTVLALRMTNCGTHEVVWSGEFNVADQAMLRSFSLITLRVATSLGSVIDRENASLGRKNCRTNAYLHYLDGMSWLTRLDLPHLRRARKSFTQALDVNPQFAPPRAKIAQTLYLEWLQRGGNDPDLLAVAREQSELALSADPNDAMGYWMKGTVALYQRDFEACEANFAEAEALAPNSADLLLQYADALSHLGDADEGWIKYEKAIDINPTPPEHYWWAGASIACQRQNYQQAIDICGRLRDDEPVLSILARSYALLGDLGTARDYGARIRELFPDAIVKSNRVTPDRRPIDREHRLEGLRLAGIHE